MDLIRAPKKRKAPDPRDIARDSSGIALFMVIAAVSLLAILVTEFTYIASISQSIAFGGLDQAKAHYLAKSGLKLSLLRLKAYSQVKALTGGAGGGIPGVPKSLVEKIWNFPFFYPLPTNIPGMSPTDKDAIEKFQKASNLDGKFSTLIESESSKYNLNLLLASTAPSPSPGASPTAAPSAGPTSGGAPNPSPAPSFDPQEAREGLFTFLNTILAQKSEADPDFAANYRDFKLEEFVDNVAAWTDRRYERRNSGNQDKVPMKRAPFYSLTELHMLPNLDDELYKLFTHNLTVSPTPGINVNTMKEPTLRALVPAMTPEEVTDFFKFRDSDEADNLFTGVDKFYDYLSKGVAAFKGNQQAITDFQTRLAKSNIFLVTDETQFKITVRAQVNNAVRTIEAWVTLGGGSSPSPSASPTPGAVAQNPQGVQQPPAAPNPGLKITFMRIL